MGWDTNVSPHIRPACRVSVPGVDGETRSRRAGRVPRRCSWHRLCRSRWHSSAAPGAAPSGSPKRLLWVRFPYRVTLQPDLPHPRPQAFSLLLLCQSSCPRCGSLTTSVSSVSPPRRCSPWHDPLMPRAPAAAAGCAAGSIGAVHPTRGGRCSVTTPRRAPLVPPVAPAASVPAPAPPRPPRQQTVLTQGFRGASREVEGGDL